MLMWNKNFQMDEKGKNTLIKNDPLKENITYMQLAFSAYLRSSLIK